MPESPDVGDSVWIRIKNIAEEKCDLVLFYGGYSQKAQRIIVPIHAKRFGVSMFFGPKAPNTLELVNYNVRNVKVKK